MNGGCVQIDLETVRWLLSAFFLISGSLITWLLGRKVVQVDNTLNEHDGRIDVNLQ